jgi:hypothetical protein
MANRWIGFVVTTAANVTIFTPLDDASVSRGLHPVDYWEENFEQYPSVGNHGVVYDPKQAAKIVDAIVRAGFDVIFAEQRN